MPPALDHTAIAVNSLDEALERYGRLFDAHLVERLHVRDQQIEAAFVSVDGAMLELIEPTSEDSPVARSIQKRGEGLHHIAFAVADIHAELRRLKESGARLVDREPRRGVHGLMAFVHPESTSGVLVELVQNDP
ncbi:MAG: methylmalonyl-CoA epimerase [Chloroflexota bacterium]|nr:MAG: methylmalonyl-CoA epimerase [Chloroflexota bacterium]